MLKKYSVLVVEDERPLLEAISDKLRRSQFEVISARTVEQAKSYVKDTEVSVNVIWLDHYLLGSETGLDFVTWLKGSDSTKNIPVFVVSNTASPAKLQSYIRLGATKYFTKSDYKLEEIISDIKDFMSELEKDNNEE